MIYGDIKQIFSSTSSLTTVSYFTREESEYLLNDEILSNFPFGRSDKDYVEVSVFSMENDLVTSSYFSPTGKYEQITKSYYDVFNRFTEYSYKTFQSELVVVGSETKSLFLDLTRHLKSAGVSEGNYKVGIQLIRDVVGSHRDNSDTLIVDEISTSRTELSVIPSAIRSDNTVTADEFYSFSSDKIFVKNISDDLLFKISRPEIFNLYYRAAAQNPTGSNSLMFYYGFKKDIDVVAFITDVYYGIRKNNRRNNGEFTPNDILGIYDQFSNWLYQNHEISVSFEDLKVQYHSFFRFIIDRELNTLSTQKPAEYDSIVSFLRTIYYDSIFYPAIYSIEKDHIDYISGYFKNYINFGDGRMFPIMNTKTISSQNSLLHDKLVIKLKDPLPEDIKNGSKLLISNTFASPPILQNIYFFLKPEVILTKLRGPNFLVKFENEGNSTELVSTSDMFDVSGSFYNELLSKLNAKTSSSAVSAVDYRYFENFINFSSANVRLQIYDSKVNAINSFKTEIEDLDEKIEQEIYRVSQSLALNIIAAPIDQYYLDEKEKANRLMNEVIGSFDGYEKFLFDNPDWYSEHSNVYGTFSSASLYDRDNQNNLINSIPSFLVEDELNEDYVKFVSMIGHYFDNLAIFIRQFTDKNDSALSPSRGISMNLVHDALVSLGWDPEVSRENAPFLLSAFSKYDFEESSPLYSKTNNLSEDDRNKLIWKRILNSLPFIYKTKGTEASINAIISCFGIPKNLLKVKEYGGTDYNPDRNDSGIYVFDDIKYEPYFSGSGEYFQLDWTGSINTVEFDLSFDRSRTNAEGDVFRLVNCDDNWIIGAYKDRGEDIGSVFFSIDDGSSNKKTLATGKIPLFDGSTYSVMFRKNYIGRTNEYPVEYELYVKKADSGRIVFHSSSSFTLSGSYNDMYQTGSNIFFGNYKQSVVSFVDPQPFWGNIDEIKLWETPLDAKSYDGHVLHRGGYSYSDPNTMVQSLLVRASFTQPINLYSVSGTASLNNIAFRDDFESFKAINFYSRPAAEDECGVSDSSAVYPYQFSVKNIVQSVRVSSYGPTTFRNNKISHVKQTLVSDLSSDHRSTLNASDDSSIDSNKVGVFFSPIDFQNEEILKFFGDYNFGELIGDPKLSYEKSYREFEKFRQIYYDEGFGIVDYQTFMNIARAYFDKAMFKYIRQVVPARTTVSDGLLIEPSILERPKIQLKPVVRETIDQSDAILNAKKKISADRSYQNSAVLSVDHFGIDFVSDINHRFYPDSPEPYGSVVYSRDGITYYNGDYYRVDVEDVKKSYRIRRKYHLSSSQYVPDGDRDIDKFSEEITRTYKQVNLIHLPDITDYPFSIAIRGLNLSESFHFSGSLTMPLSSSSGNINVPITSSHNISGTISGSFYGYRDGEDVAVLGTVFTPLKFSGSFIPGNNPSTSATYSGSYYQSGLNYSFNGIVTLNSTSNISWEIIRCRYQISALSELPKSIYELLSEVTTGTGLFSSTRELTRRLEASLLTVPNNRILLDGYFSTHYKYRKQTFSYKEINSYDSSNFISSIGMKGRPFKWKKHSQNRTTTVDQKTGNLNGSDPFESKKAV